MDYIASNNYLTSVCWRLVVVGTFSALLSSVKAANCNQLQRHALGVMNTRKCSRLVVAALLGSIGATAFGSEAPTCNLFLYALDRTGTPLLPALIAPDDVAESSVQPHHSSASQTWHFVLKEHAARRMSAYSKQNIGHPMAIFCGDKEVSRPTIRGEFSTRIMVSLPAREQSLK